MNIKEILLEETYNLGKVISKIFDEVIQVFYEMAQSNPTIKKKKADISKYFPNIKAPVTLTMKINKKVSPGAYITQSRDDDEVMNYDLDIQFSREDFDEDFSYFKKEYYNYLKHEIVHMFDSNRSKGFALYKTKTNYREGIFKYLKDPTEFNALIHEVMTFRTNNKKTWDKKNTYSSLKKYIQDGVYLLRKEGNFWKPYDINQEEILFKAVFKRLARENLLPRMFGK